MSDVLPLGRFAGMASTALSERQRNALDMLVDGRGTVPAPYRFLIASPLVVEHLGALGTALRKEGELSFRELEIVVLITAGVLQTPFVLAAHREIAVKAGLAEETIEKLIAGAEADLNDPREKMTCDLAKALHRYASVPQGLAKDSEAVLGSRAIAEIIAVIAVYTATCYTMRFVDAQPPNLVR